MSQTAAVQATTPPSIGLYGLTRITVHLPVTNSDSAKTRITKNVAEKIINKFKNRHGGSTYVSVHHSNFIGSWINTHVTPSYPMEGVVALLMIDAPFDFHDVQATSDAIDEIRKYAFEEYSKAGVGQFEVWVTSSPVMIRLPDGP